MQLPEQYKDLINGKAVAQLATIMPDGSPQVTPVWFDYDGEYIRVNSAAGRVKDRNMRRDARVAVSISDPSDPYRHFEVRGRVAPVDAYTLADADNLRKACGKKVRALMAKERDKFVLRSITDEVMYEIMSLSGQEYVDEYAARYRARLESADAETGAGAQTAPTPGAVPGRADERRET